MIDIPARLSMKIIFSPNVLLAPNLLIRTSSTRFCASESLATTCPSGSDALELEASEATMNCSFSEAYISERSVTLIWDSNESSTDDEFDY